MTHPLLVLIFLTRQSLCGNWINIIHAHTAETNFMLSLQRRHNEREVVSNHQPHDCLLNRSFRRRSKKTSKLRVTGLCEGNSPGTGEFLAQRASNAENVSIWWRHHVYFLLYSPRRHGEQLPLKASLIKNKKQIISAHKCKSLLYSQEMNPHCLCRFVGPEFNWSSIQDGSVFHTCILLSCRVPSNITFSKYDNGLNPSISSHFWDTLLMTISV